MDGTRTRLDRARRRARVLQTRARTAQVRALLARLDADAVLLESRLNRMLAQESRVPLPLRDLVRPRPWPAPTGGPPERG